MVRFKYQGKDYETWNLKKELRKLGIKESDIEIYPEEKKIAESMIPYSNAWYELNKWKFVGYSLNGIPCLLMKRPTDETLYENEFNTHKEYEEWFKKQLL